jgi:hypothetical protein
MYFISLKLIQPWLIFDKPDEELDIFDASARVRSKFYFDLIEEYHYPPSRIVFDVILPASLEQRVADVVAYKDASHNKPFLVAECRGEWLQDERFIEMCSYALEKAEILEAPYAVGIAGSRMQVMNSSDGSRVTGIPEWSGS